jgi:hypothetical protein
VGQGLYLGSPGAMQGQVSAQGGGGAYEPSFRIEETGTYRAVGGQQGGQWGIDPESSNRTSKDGEQRLALGQQAAVGEASRQQQPQEDRERQGRGGARSEEEQQVQQQQEHQEQQWGHQQQQQWGKGNDRGASGGSSRGQVGGRRPQDMAGGATGHMQQQRGVFGRLESTDWGERGREVAVAARQENSRMQSYASEQDGLQSEFSARHRAQEREEERWRENQRRKAPVDEFFLERVVAREQQRQNLGGWARQQYQDRKEPSVAEQSRKEENNRKINRDREDRAERRALREQESTTEQKKRRKKEEHQEMSGKMKGLPD